MRPLKNMVKRKMENLLAKELKRKFDRAFHGNSIGFMSQKDLSKLRNLRNSGMIISPAV